MRVLGEETILCGAWYQMDTVKLGIDAAYLTLECVSRIYYRLYSKSSLSNNRHYGPGNIDANKNPENS